MKPGKAAHEQPLPSGHLEAVCTAGERLAAYAALPVDRATFLARYYEQDTEDLAGDPAALAAAALGHLRFGLERAARTAKLRVFNPTLEHDGWVSEHTIVETVNDDMPFLVDSLSMTLTSMGHAIHVTIHPILHVERSAEGKLRDVRYEKGRDWHPAIAALPPSMAVGAGAAKPESFIHIEIVRETDPQLLAAIERALADVLRDVRAAVEDWKPMLEQLAAATAELRATRGLDEESKLESCEFLEWLALDHFTLLGYREYELTEGGAFDTLAPRAGLGLGLLRDDPRGDETVRLAGRARDEARSANPLVITKSSERSTVHRPATFDHIGVKVFDAGGRPRLERRFLGLFTSVAYSESARDIPLLRLKARRVLEQSELDPRGHRGKALQHILDTLPRDDLFQASLEDLRTISHGVLGLQERRKLKLFCRRETFGRFYSCLVYLPRDQYSERARRTIENVLLTALSGNAVESEVAISEAALARLAVTVRTTPGELEEPDVGFIQRDLENAVRSWQDRLRDALLAELPEDRALELLHRYGDRFSAAYQEEADSARARHDVQKLARLDEAGSDLEIALVRPQADRPERLRLTTFKRGEPIPLYVALPMLENFGFKVTSERVYPLAVAGNPKIQDFEIETADKKPLDPAALGARFEQCFALVLKGEADNDGFNSFVVSAGLDWRQAALLRAFCKYLLQTRSRYSQAYVQETLNRYPLYCRALVDKFASLFDVDAPEAARAERLAASDDVLKRELDRAASLDDDRILRSFGAVVSAIVRTNYYQTMEGTANGTPKPYLSFKLDSSTLPFLPKPKPKFEIFVYAQRVEGVHLRNSKVARGGIRWSDRREDFRTEVLGLMKAQQVKNTVIVPSGAKGGFVCKALPTGDRDAIQREVVACYQTFIRGLLDITDNIVDNAVVPPQRVIRKDDDDPYLVVAADKGTATFSDIANALSAEYGFWLGDAFASGGSAGYDHKKMAITARGGWEAVKRHFRELKLDTQRQELTVVGVGDMSGDVFGNGMLQSPKIKLVAAFDHRHVFIDPNPDPERSFAERARMFALPRSSWDDYDRAALSEGGGVYSRQAKSIELTPAAQAVLGVGTPTLSPPELVRAVLLAPVDLLWNGGIGTYVKASHEAHGDARDPSNDAVRVDGRELRCKVVGEGGNLGFTQLGRVEYATHGGRINTDFIDNSGGVDCSDREVNIKILLDDAIRRRALPREQRNGLLAAMTDDVAGLVLADNYAQTQALSIMESRAAERLGEHARLIRVLEAQGLLDRALELLPAEEEIEQRRAGGRGLTRPELAVILSYSKIELVGSLVHTNIPEDPYLGTELESYFPPQLRTPIGGLIRKHRLGREIIAMLVGGSMVNRMGPFFVLRAEEETGASVAQVARAYAIVREVFAVRRLWREIEGLDHKVEARVQYDSIFEIGRMVRRAVYWFLQNYPNELDIEPLVMRFRAGAAELLAALPQVLSPRSRDHFERDRQACAGRGVPDDVARRIAALGTMTQTLDIVELAREFRLSVHEVGALYFTLAAELRLDTLRDQIEGLAVEGRWRAMARATLRETLAREQRGLLRAALRGKHAGGPADALREWLEKHAATIARTQRAIDEMQASGAMDFATLSVALKEISRLA